MPNILGIDVGEKKIGLAIGQTETKFAFVRPALLVSSWDEVWPALSAMVTKEDVTMIVLGWPLNADGSAGPQTAEVQQFMDELRQHVTVPMMQFDERLSSQEVQREQRGRRLSRGEEDSLAAQVVLESYLQSLP